MFDYIIREQIANNDNLLVVGSKSNMVGNLIAMNMGVVADTSRFIVVDCVDISLSNKPRQKLRSDIDFKISEFLKEGVLLVTDVDKLAQELMPFLAKIMCNHPKYKVIFTLRGGHIADNHHLVKSKFFRLGEWKRVVAA